MQMASKKTEKIDTDILPEKENTTMLWLVCIVSWFASYVPYIGFFALIAYAYIASQLSLSLITKRAIKLIKAGEQAPKFGNEIVSMLVFAVLAVIPLLVRLGIEAIGDVATLGIGFIFSIIGFGINIAVYLYFILEAKKKYERNVAILTSKK